MIIDDIALTLEPGIGPRTAIHLIETFGSASEIYRTTSAGLIEKAGLRPDIARSLSKKLQHRNAEKEFRKCEKSDIIIIPSHNPDYPPLLREIHDYPHIIYLRGSVDALKKTCLSVVGTRKITSYGQRAVDDIINGLCAAIPDLCVVSGLAYGIDGAAHRAALANGVATAAVLAGHVGHIYPTQHTPLAAQILKQGGCVLSEYHSGINQAAGTFVARNRIVAGLSAGTLVVESGARGGSLITANLAAGYYRSVMAVPGRATDDNSAGTNRLIKDNKAAMVTTAADVIREMMWEDMVSQPASGKAEPEVELSPEAAKLLARLESGTKYDVDRICTMSGNDISSAIGLVIELELSGSLVCHPGKIYEKL